MCKKMVLFACALFSSHLVHAENTTIQRANNQAFIDGQLGDEWIRYSNNHPADAGAPLYNGHGANAGVQFGLAKTFDRIYSQLLLGANRSQINYSERTLGTNTTLSSGNSVQLFTDVRVGYRFDPRNNIAITPYILGGYANSQLNTGGLSASFISAYYNGATLTTQAFYYGLGLLNQWAVNPRWVLSADVQVGSEYHPWVSGNVNNFNNQPGATTTYQKWNLSPAILTKIGLGSDYLFAQHWHFRSNVTYAYNKIGGSNTETYGIYPAQTHTDWLVRLGLGYDFAGGDNATLFSGGGQKAIQAVNNQAALQVGYQTLYFDGGLSSTALAVNSYKTQGSVPDLGIILTKTWQKWFTQVSFTQAYGETFTQSVGSSHTSNTVLDTAAKVGYSLATSQNTSVIPYATLGYLRWAQNNQGASAPPYFVNGSTNTYQHNWIGLGLLGQWASSPRLVLSADANFGSTFNGNMNNWTPVGLTVDTQYSLGNAGYYMLGAGADYLLTKKWHAQANINYLHFRYGSTNPNAFGISSLNDSAHRTTVNLGIGYSFA